VPEQQRRGSYDEVLAEGLAAACLALAPVFALLTVWHPVALDPPAGPVLALVAAGTTGVLLHAARALHRRPPAHGHRLVAALMGLVLLHGVAQYALTGVLQLTVVTAVLVGTGICVLDPRWLTGLLGAQCLAWSVAIALVDGSRAALTTLPEMALGAAVAALAHVVRGATLDRLLTSQAELRALSQLDELTGLLNRRGFLEAAEARLGRGRRVRVWFADVDGLKAVNDQHGHDVGDVLLVSVATALSETFAGGVVARLSGDEFAVVEDHVGPGGTVEARAALAERLALAAEATGLPVSVSTGVATAEPGASLSELLSAADAAMYAGRAQGRTIRLSEGESARVGARSDGAGR
jgi:diguanylate cyclase (GGDEF)-like protein